MRPGFRILAETPLFCAVNPMVDLAEGDDRWIGVEFIPGVRRGK